MTIQYFREQFEPYIQNRLAGCLAEVKGVTDNACVLAAVAHATRLVQEGGKRVRPYSCCQMVESSGLPVDATLLELAVAFELFHMFALVHDDIIDQGKLRHGLPTVHIYLEDWLRQAGREGDLAHIATGQAMLVGDLLANWSFQTIQQSRLTPVQKEQVLILFHRMMHDVLIGEMLDVDVTTQTSVPLSAIIRKTELKTAWYTFVYPMQIGAVLAQAPVETLEFTRQFGVALGLAFQHQDDLLDIFGSATEAQKSLFQEVQNNQHTLLSHYMETAAAPYRRRWAHLRARGGSGAAIQALLEEAGARQSIEQEVARCFQVAQQSLDASPLNEEARQPWQVLLTYLAGRTG